MPGNRPSNMFLFPKLSAYEVGQLLALYEHRTAVEGFIWGLNSFDQFGVELGKVFYFLRLLSFLFVCLVASASPLSGFSCTPFLLLLFLSSPGFGYPSPKLSRGSSQTLQGQGERQRNQRERTEREDGESVQLLDSLFISALCERGIFQEGLILCSRSFEFSLTRRCFRRDARAIVSIS
jgi:hypothetical protein